MATVALLLNASFEPLKVVSARRAVVLVLSGKAEVVEAGDARFRYEHGEVTVPAVLRLVKFVRVPYRATVPLTRRAVRSWRTVASAHTALVLLTAWITSYLVPRAASIAGKTWSLPVGPVTAERTTVPWLSWAGR